MKTKFFKSLYITPLLAISLLGCQPDEFEDSNGLVSGDLDPTFTITPVAVEGKTNTFQFELNNVDEALAIWWTLGNGSEVSGMKKSDVVFFPDQGTYLIKAKVVGIGGEVAESEQEFVVSSPDPLYGNLISGGLFGEGDEELWTVLQYSGGVLPTFGDGKVVFDYGGWAHAGIYQSFEAEAGQKYRVDMTVSGEGASDTWFEVYIGDANPVGFAGDYNDEGTRLALNTWAGCGKTKFADQLAKLSCAGSLSGDINGVFEVPTSGTYYLVIRTGGADLGDGGISLDNVEIRPYFE